jgi:hypothetical protein
VRNANLPNPIECKKMTDAIKTPATAIQDISLLIVKRITKLNLPHHRTTSEQHIRENSGRSTSGPTTALTYSSHRTVLDLDGFRHFRSTR